MCRSIVSRFERLGLQRRIMLYVTAGLIAFSAIFGFVALRAIQQSSDLVFRERLLIARAVAHEIDDDLEHFQQEIQDASASLAPALARDPIADVDAQLRSLCNHWLPIDGSGAPCTLWITDPHGLVLWSNASETTVRADDLSQLHGLTLSNGYLSDGSTRPAVVFANPLSDGTGITGFVIGEIDGARLKSRMEPSLQIVQGHYAVEVIDERGVIVATNQPDQQRSMSPHFPLVAQLWRNGQAGIRSHALTVNGTERGHVVTFAPLRRVHWGIVVEQEEDEAFALPRQLQAQFIGLAVLALLGGLVLAWVTTTAVVQPVKRLIQATQEIAQGNLDHPLALSGGDEVGALAHQFDQMRIALRGSRDEIAGWNRELEIRVQRRTRELAALVESSHALTQTLDLDGLLTILMKETHEVLPSAEGAALFLFDRETEELVVHAAFGLDPAESIGLRLRRREAIAGQVFETQTPVRLQTAEQVHATMATLTDENRTRLPRTMGGRPIKCAMGVPLRSKGAHLGVLTLYNFSEEAAFTDHAVSILQALANQAATAIENARLYHEASEAGALRELNRLKSEFVARASHELRTPLTAIKSLAESLLRRDLQLDPQTEREFLEGINSSADRLGAIVDQLLTLARIESGKLGIRREPLDVGAIMTQIAEQIRAQTPTRDIQLEIAPALPLVLGDRERLGDVLTNLISNALKYSGPDTCVQLHAEGCDGRVVLAVADQGIGIPAEERDRIFERFYRVDNAVTRRVGGAGLGLHICKVYVEAMSGTIAVENNGGHGSIFKVTLMADTHPE